MGTERLSWLQFVPILFLFPPFFTFHLVKHLDVEGEEPYSTPIPINMVTEGHNGVRCDKHTVTMWAAEHWNIFLEWWLFYFRIVCFTQYGASCILVFNTNISIKCIWTTYKWVFCIQFNGGPIMAEDVLDLPKDRCNNETDD